MEAHNMGNQKERKEQCPQPYELERGRVEPIASLCAYLTTRDPIGPTAGLLPPRCCIALSVSSLSPIPFLGRFLITRFPRSAGGSSFSRDT